MKNLIKNLIKNLTKNQMSNRDQMIEQRLERVGFGFIGLFGVGIFVPNLFLFDSNTFETILAGKIGLIASGTFMLSGITGMFHNKYIPKKIGHVLFVSAVSLQSMAIIIPCLIHELRKKK